MDKNIDFLLYGNKFKKLYEKELTELRERYDLKRIDVDILYYLFHSGSNNTSRDIVELNLFNKGHISQSVCHLQEHNLIECVHDSMDRRCVHLRLTARAYDVVKHIEEIHEKVMDMVFNGITEEEKLFLADIASKLRGNIEIALED